MSCEETLRISGRWRKLRAPFLSFSYNPISRAMQYLIEKSIGAVIGATGKTYNARMYIPAAEENV